MVTKLYKNRQADILLDGKVCVKYKLCDPSPSHHSFFLFYQSPAFHYFTSLQAGTQAYLFEVTARDQAVNWAEGKEDKGS